MKKIITIISVTALMSFTYYNNYRIEYAIENLEEMREYMVDDIETGYIDPVLGQIYVDLIDDTDLLLREERKYK